MSNARKKYGARQESPSTSDESDGERWTQLQTFQESVERSDATGTRTQYLQEGEAVSDVVTESQIGRTWPDLAYGVLRRFKNPAVPAASVAAAIVIIGAWKGMFETWGGLSRLGCGVGAWLVLVFVAVAVQKWLTRTK